MSETVQVRLATRADLGAIASFQVDMAWETERKRLEPSTVTAGVGGVFDDPSRGFYWVVDVDGELVASLLVTREWSDWRNTDMWYIQSVYVQPMYRGRGYFRRMYQQVVQEAKRVGTSVIRLYVENDNQAAQNVYERLGMKALPYLMYQADVGDE